MASAEATEVFNCTKEEFFNIISDYEKYPEFLAEVDKCEVVQNNGDQKLVEYSVSLIKSFKYKLKMQESRPHHIEWELDSGDIFKVSNGSWTLEEVEGDKVKAHYQVEAKFKGFVPGPVAKGLVSVNLPNMMKSYHKRVKEIYGK